MEAATLLLRTILIYFVIYLVIRMMGKREIGKLSVFDLVISIMIAEMAVFVLEDIKKPIWEGVAPILVLAAAQVLIAFATLKSRRLRQLFDGKPSLLIDRGKLNREEMKKERYSLDDLLLQLRENKVMNVADVEFAILEPTGKLSIKTKDQQSQKDQQRQQGKTNVKGFRYEGLPVPLIMDGKVQDEGLEKIGQNRFWLKKELLARGVLDMKNVFLCTIDHRGQLFINMK